MLNRVLAIFGIVALAVGAYSAWTTNHPGLGILLTLGAIAVAIPTFLEPKK